MQDTKGKVFGLIFGRPEFRLKAALDTLRPLGPMLELSDIRHRLSKGRRWVGKKT